MREGFRRRALYGIKMKVPSWGNEVCFQRPLKTASLALEGIFVFHPISRAVQNNLFLKAKQVILEQEISCFSLKQVGLH